MGVYIRGMEMPENCGKCVENRNMFCDLLGRKLKIPCDYVDRPTACPIVPVPPHGDLLDRDAVLESAYELPLGQHACFEIVDASAIEKLPVIIPAERAKEKA